MTQNISTHKNIDELKLKNAIPNLRTLNITINQFSASPSKNKEMINNVIQKSMKEIANIIEKSAKEKPKERGNLTIDFKFVFSLTVIFMN